MTRGFAPANGRALGVANRAITQSVIPDSVDYQYVAESFASPWPDEIQSADMSITGLTSSTFSNGEESVAGDGTDDHGLANGPQNLPENKTFGIAFTLEFQSPNSNEQFIASMTGTSAEFVTVRTNVRGTAGSIEVAVRDGNNNVLEVYTDNTYDNGTPRAVVINKNGNSATDISIYVDEMADGKDVPVSVYSDEAFDHTNYVAQYDMGFYAQNAEGTIQNYANIDAGVWEFNTAPYSESERQGFVNRRPEV